jgi:3-mercaptopyruvate sulfurtransferase SseA
MTSDALRANIDALEKMAEELELAARHARTAARHFSEKDIPRAGAHALATSGHMASAQALFNQVAAEHARHSTP